MKKRGQVTTYVLIGLIVLVLISAVVYFTWKDSGSEVGRFLTFEQQAENVRNTVEICFNDQFLLGLYALGLQGGYIIPPRETEPLTRGISVAYGYYEGEDILISKEEMRNQLIQYINFMVPSCTDFDSFDGFSFEYDEPTSRAEIRENEVWAGLNFPITVSKDNKSIYFENQYSVIYPVRLGYIHDVMKNIVRFQIVHPDYVDVTYLDDTGLIVSVMRISDTKNIYIISDDKSSVEGLPFAFAMANKFKDE